MTQDERYPINSLDEIFFKNITTVKSQNTVPFGPLVYSLIHSINPSIIVETGSNSGYITAWMAKACLELQNRKFYTVDWYKREHLDWYEEVDGVLDKKIKQNLEKCGVIKGVTRFINAEAISWALDYERQGLFNGLGFVMIDDCHNEEHVYIELGIFWRNLVPGGMIALHDVEDMPTVQRAVLNFVERKGISRRLWFFASSGFAILQKDW